MSTEVVVTRKLPEEKYNMLETFIDELDDRNGVLIRVLHRAQEIFGFLPQEVQVFISKKLGIPTAKIFGVVTFYSYFTMEPKGKYEISVCMGTACYVKGAEKILREFEQLLGITAGQRTDDGRFSLTALRCIGACGLAPVVMVGEKVYGKMTVERVKEILEEYRL